MDIELGEVQAKFADIIWEREPIASGELTKICEKRTGMEKINDIYSSEKIM